ncbi:MAG: DUF1835 domain-containing protein, partial [Bacillus sp. (in: Bacteria)]|nr:DUF1835 domain-containing protein [Bacillus sp. (in: firmicutes)]
MIHIVNGDVLGSKLGDLPGAVLVWREMYDFGPLVADSTQQEWIKRRAQFFEKKIGIPAPFFIKNCEEQNRYLDEIPRDKEIVLWFEHDRYDQTMLMYLLNELSKKKFENLSMVTIKEYPGVDTFYGLGQLTSQQLEELYINNKKSISTDKIKEAITGWMAYTSENPTDIEKWIMASFGKLPFLKKALQSHLSYFPSAQTGLNEVETIAVDFINTNTTLFTELYLFISKHRIIDGLSDLHFSALLNELINSPYPLLACDRPLPSYQNPEPIAKLLLTSYGLEFQKKQRNRFESVGRDWWIGGV